MATTTIEKTKANLIKRFHTLLTKTGMDDFDKQSILSEFGVTSSKDLTIVELLESCNALEKMANPQLAELDKLRKRVIASIGDYLRVMNETESIEKIKFIACRAAKEKNFNNISATKLRALYNAFNEYKKRMVSVSKITENILINQE